MKIVQFGLCFSPNLGDGVIAECIAHGIISRRPDAEVFHVDLSARQARGEVMIANRDTILKVLDRLPLGLRQALASWKLNRLMNTVEDRWRDAAKADLAVIGGGQILSDANLNFPIKISRAAGIIAAQGTPCAVYGVGVSENWTTRGAALFQKLFDTDLRLVGVRDVGSESAWRAQVKHGPAPERTLDPGLLAADHYGAVASPQGIGICITDFGLLAHHASGDIAGTSATPLEFYASLAIAAVNSGHRATLFCNGAAEDVALLNKVATSPKLAALRKSGQVSVPATPVTPSELVAIIAGCKAIIAHRLHACIVAYSYGRSIVGLGWDAKLQSFFESAGQDACFSSDPQVSAADLVAMATTSLAAGIDMEHQKRLILEAWDGIDRLLSCAATATDKA